MVVVEPKPEHTWVWLIRMIKMSEQAVASPAFLLYGIQQNAPAPKGMLCDDTFCRISSISAHFSHNLKLVLIIRSVPDNERVRLWHSSYFSSDKFPKWWYCDNINMLNRGAEGAIMSAAGRKEGGWCCGYIWWVVFLCDYALRRGNARYLCNTQKVAPSSW